MVNFYDIFIKDINNDLLNVIFTHGIQGNSTFKLGSKNIKFNEDIDLNKLDEDILMILFDLKENNFKNKDILKLEYTYLTEFRNILTNANY